MKIVIKVDPINSETIDDDSDFSIDAVFESGEFSNIDSVVTMFYKACELEGYTPLSIEKSMFNKAEEEAFYNKHMLTCYHKDIIKVEENE